MEQMLAELLMLINLERAKVGAQALAYRPEIEQASNIRAQEASQAWSHTRPNGTPYYSADDRIWGENLAKNFGTAQDILNAWMNSESHRKNILNATYKGACLGFFKQGNENFISLEFTKE